MPTVHINGEPLDAREGATILDAAREAGIEIPTLCWYPQLPIVGNCRICVVSVEGADKLAPACATAVADGMRVETESDDAVSARRGVLEMLLERYPADHLTNGHGTGPRNEFEEYVTRYGVTPRPTASHELPLRAGDERPGDPMISHDMSLCILCTRCVRACEDIQVVGVLDVAYRGERAQIVVGNDGDPDKAACTWCGECVRVCPTGAIFEVMPRERFGTQRTAPEKVVRSVCPYCGVGCQVDLEVKDNEVLRVTSPSFEEITPNQGSTCVKGRFGYDFTQHRDRLTTPLIRTGWTRRDGAWIWEGPSGVDRRTGPWHSMSEEGLANTASAPPRATGKRIRDLPLLERVTMDLRDRAATPPDWRAPFREATWDEALELATQELTRIHRTHGSDAMAVFQSAKCTNEENYLLQRLFRGAFGTNNIDHCTRLCHSTSVSAMQAALNTAAASGSMREVEEACDVIFIAGANTTETHPVFGAALKRAHEQGACLIVADPRRTELAARADIHLQMQPGTDVALYNGMLHHILAEGLEDRAFIASRTHNFDAVRAAVQPYTPERAATITGIPADVIRAAAERYARGPNTSTLWAMGLTQHLTGHEMVTAMLNLILATGMIGRWGAAMMPVRGQNNVQGASDMGAIPFVYPDYQSVADPAIRDKFAAAWGVDPASMSLTPGLKVTEMAREGSPTRALFIMGENPIISDPDIAHAEAWFRQIEFLAVQDLFLTETARYADVILPGAAFAEKTGTFVNTERRIQLAEQAIDPPGDARADWDILVELSERIGLASGFASPADVMNEIRQVAPAWGGVTYDRLRGGGLQYPVPDETHPGTSFLFADAFPTEDGKATFAPVEYADPGELPDEEFPFVMNTGRQLYHWHTGTMTRRSKGLDAREPTAIVEMHPDDAEALGVTDGDLVKMTSRRNAIVISVRTSDRVARNQVFVPFHFREAAANLLTNPVLEPHAKMAALKITAVRIEPVASPVAPAPRPVHPHMGGKVALVCGSSQGLGYAAAAALAAEGCRVALNGRDAARLDAAIENVRRHATADVAGFAADVSVPAEATRLVETVRHELGSVDILVCNAGGPAAAPFVDTPADSWQAALELNLLSTVHLSRAAVPIMRRAGWGRIVCITSIAAKQPLPGLILSSTARAGVLGFAKTLADELADVGITVNVVCPGYMRTGRVEDLAHERAVQTEREPADVLADLVGDVPMGRMGQPEELAAAIAFLASEPARYITGAVLQVDGGFTRSII